MKKHLLFFSILVLSIIIFGCSDDKAVTEITKDQSIEITLETQSLADTAVLLISKQNVYLKGQNVKTITHTDTLPFPGFKTEEIEDEQGNTKSATLPKEYEFFITVK